MEYRRRIKIITFSSQLLVDILNWSRNPQQVLALPITDEIPQDTDVVTVHPSWETNTIDAVIFHSSFPLVRNADLPPRVPGVIEKLRVVKQMEVVEK